MRKSFFIMTQFKREEGGAACGGRVKGQALFVLRVACAARSRSIAVSQYACPSIGSTRSDTQNTPRTLPTGNHRGLPLRTATAGGCPCMHACLLDSGK